MLDVVQQHQWMQQANLGGPPEEWFGYPVTIGSQANPLVVGVTQSANIAMQSDSWFLWGYLNTAVIIPTTAGYGTPSQFTFSGNLLLQITIPGMGEDLLEVPAGLAGMPASLCSGTPTPDSAGIPYVFQSPVLLPPNTNVQVNITKLGAVSATNPDAFGAYVFLAGARIPVWQ